MTQGRGHSEKRSGVFGQEWKGWNLAGDYAGLRLWAKREYFYLRGRTLVAEKRG